MKTTATLALTLALLVIAAPEAAAQVTTKPSSLTTLTEICTNPSMSLPERIKTRSCACVGKVSDGTLRCDRPQDRLTRLQDHDTSANLMAYLEHLAKVVRTEVPAEAYLRFVWIGPGSDGKPTVRSVVQAPEGKDARAGVLPGLKQLAGIKPEEGAYFDVLVGFDRTGTSPVDQLAYLESLYTSTVVANPLLEQIPEFVKRIGFIEAIAAAKGPTSPPKDVTTFEQLTVPTGPAAVFRIYAPEFPHKRASIAVKDSIVSPLSSGDFDAGVEELTTELTQGIGRASICARRLALNYSTELAKVSSCVNAAGSPYSFEANACRVTLKNALTEEYKRVLNNPALCLADTGSVGVNPATAVDDAFREYVGTLGGSVVTGDAALTNVPREKISFGVMSAVRFGTPRFSGTRATVDGGVVVADPLPRLISAVVLNWHPLGFDSSKLGTWKDRGAWKLSAGATVSPDFGLIATAGYSPIKGLTINVGYAILLANSPKEGVALGAAVPDEFKDDPFRQRRIGTPVWGLSYSF